MLSFYFIETTLKKIRHGNAVNYCVDVNESFYTCLFESYNVRKKEGNNYNVKVFI